MHFLQPSNSFSLILLLLLLCVCVFFFLQHNNNPVEKDETEENTLFTFLPAQLWTPVKKNFAAYTQFFFGVKKFIIGAAVVIRCNAVVCIIN